jgi:uncharacterized secreted protein with C-terminal beta-propeller domain
MRKIKTENKFFFAAFILLIAVAVIAACDGSNVVKPPVNPVKMYNTMPHFMSDQQLLDAFEEARSRNRGGVLEAVAGMMQTKSFGATSAISETVSDSSSRSYSTTNIQVEGVDEADIVKTDGDYIYAIAGTTQKKLFIVKATPAEKAKIVSSINLDSFQANEFFIDGDRILLFGQTSFDVTPTVKENNIDRYYNYQAAVEARLYDISDKENPELLKKVDIEGSYLTSRKIGDYAYYVVNSYPRYNTPTPLCKDLVPQYKEDDGNVTPIAECTEIGYIEPIQAENFITIAAISMSDENEEVHKETVVGSGQNVYASQQNLYIAQTSWPVYRVLSEVTGYDNQKTTIMKFVLDNGKIGYVATGEVKGHILNQFSMDEFEDNFRIATTAGEVWDSEHKSTNNVYVLDEDMKTIGSLEGLAPGEKIYSVRFMGKRGYVVTFKKVDPLFVIDLSTPSLPNVLGKLKIPGYSDYLHPIDENHIIGIGKDAVDAEQELVDQRNLDFAWYQGIKMAVFDVSDVEHPIEMYKVLIGDRGTDSEALHNHKAFLFDKEKELLVIPVTLAKVEGEKTSPYQYGNFVFQGAYVFKLNLEDGFELKGKISHYDSDEAFQKSGYYFDGQNSIRRSLYIDNTLYTLSDSRLQANDLDSLDTIKKVNFDNVVVEENTEVEQTSGSQGTGIIY